MKNLCQGPLTAVLACLCVTGLLASAQAQVIKIPATGGQPKAPADNKTQPPGPKVLPQIKGGPFPTVPRPTQPTLDYVEISRLARKLTRETGRLHDAVDDRDLDSNDGRRLHREVRVIEQLADRVELLANQKGAPLLLAQQLTQLRTEVRTADRMVSDLSRNRDISRRTAEDLRDRLAAIDDLVADIGREMTARR